MNTLSSPRRGSCRQRGLSLVECLAALAVVAIVVGLSVPSMGAAIERRNLEGAAAQLRTDIHMARAEALAHNRNMRIGFVSTTAGSCYVVHTGTAAECTCQPGLVPQCGNGVQVVRSASFLAAGPLAMRSNVASMVLDAGRGTVSPTGTLRFTGRQGREVRLVVNIMGRVRFCTPNADLKGYPRC